MNMAHPSAQEFVIYSSYHLQRTQVESVVAMAVYEGDSLRWLQQAVRSVLNQGYRDFVFCIVIDGPISDEIRLLLSQLDKDEEQVILIETEVNRGLAACMNAVINYAVEFSPTYFFRMDADDICFKGRLGRQVAYFNTHESVDILGSAITEIDEVGKNVGRRSVPKRHHEIMRVMPKRCLLNHPTVGIRYSVFQAGFRYRAELQNTQDYFLWVDLAAAGYTFANIDKPLLKFRRAKGFFKRRGFSKSINEFRARLYAMKRLDRMSAGNIYYACSVLLVRMLPPPLLKWMYRFDRVVLHARVKNK